MGELTLLATLASCFGAGAGALAGYLIIRRSGPVATAAMLAEVLKLRMEWQGWKAGAESVLESVDELSEVVERKRRRVAARESAQNVREDNPNSRAALLARARAQGHPV